MMKGKRVTIRTVLVLLCLTGVFLWTACDSVPGGKHRKKENLSQPVAQVNGKTISAGDLKKEVEQFRRHLSQIKDEKEGTTRKLALRILDQMIQMEILYQKSVALGIGVSPEELNKEIQHQIGDFSKGRLNLVLSQSGMTLQEWKDKVYRGMMIQKMIKQEVDQKIEIRTWEMKKRYDGNKAGYLIPERVHVKQIVVLNESEANSIRKSLILGKDFATVAKEKSLSLDSQNGGDLGLFSRGQLPKEFEETVFKLNPGEISEVVQSPYGFHLFTISARLPARQMTFDEAMPRIRNELLQEKRDQFYREWMDTLRREAKIRIFEERI